MDYSSTYRLAQDIRDSEEYKTYHGLKDSVMADETTAALIREYRKLQVTIQMAAMTGRTPEAEDQQRFSVVGKARAVPPGNQHRVVVQVEEDFGGEVVIHDLDGFERKAHHRGCGRLRRSLPGDGDEFLHVDDLARALQDRGLARGGGVGECTDGEEQGGDESALQEEDSLVLERRTLGFLRFHNFEGFGLSDAKLRPRIPGDQTITRGKNLAEDL